MSWNITVVLAIIAPLAAIWGQNDYLWYDVTEDWGISSPERLPASGYYRLPEAFNGKAVPFDFDRDGDLDLMLTYGPHIADSLYLGLNRFYRNDDTAWTDITAESGLSYMPPAANAAAGDVNGDGYLDLYLCLYGSDRFLLNDSGAKWIDITDSSGISNDYWSTEAVFIDVNRDGYLDIYVANYLEYIGSDTIICVDPVLKRRTTCDPLLYDPAPNRLFLNDSSGYFVDVTDSLGVADTSSRSLGVKLLDANCDGYLDLFVLSDKSPNLLYLNTDSGLVETGFYAGIAVTPTGNDPLWIGVIPFDHQLTGCNDLLLFDPEANITVMLNDGQGQFFQGHYQTGFYRPRSPHRATTAAATDVDFDGTPDFILSNQRDKPTKIIAQVKAVVDSSLQPDDQRNPSLPASVSRVLLKDADNRYRPVETGRIMMLDTLLLVPRRTTIAGPDTARNLVISEPLGPQDLSPSSSEDLLRNPLFELPVDQGLTSGSLSVSASEVDSLIALDSLGFVRLEMADYFEMDTLRVRQEPISLLAVDLDHDGLEEIVAGYSVGLFRIWKRKVLRPPRFIGLWPQTRAPNVPVIGAEIQIKTDRMTRRILITDTNPRLIYLPRRVRSVEVLVKWPDGHENRYRTPITNRIYTLTRIEQEP